MSAKKEFAGRLLDALWEDYAGRVPYARVYQNMLAELGGVLVNDHVAFWSLGITANGHDLGIMATYPIFASLGFDEKGAMDYSAQRLFARHLQHEEPNFPKVLISQLKVEELDEEVRNLLAEGVAGAALVLTDDDLQALRELDRKGEPPGLFEKVVRHFQALPWPAPAEDLVNRVGSASPYGGWVLLHGFRVNHFAGYVNRHGIGAVGEIELLAAELKKRGVAMRNEIEGGRGSRIRQAFTRPVRVPVQVKQLGGGEKEIEWSYSCMEFVERGEAEENGQRRLFQGFPAPPVGVIFDEQG